MSWPTLGNLIIATNRILQDLTGLTHGMILRRTIIDRVQERWFFTRAPNVQGRSPCPSCHAGVYRFYSSHPGVLTIPAVL
jgi:hypothetical protein